MALPTNLDAILNQEPTDEHYIEIGRIVVKWAKLEIKTQRAIWHLLDLKQFDHNLRLELTDYLGLSLTTHIPFRVQLDIIRSLTEYRIDDEALKNELQEIIKRIVEAQADRNFIVHNELTYIKDYGSWFTKMQARSQVKKQAYSADIEDLKKVTSCIESLLKDIDEWGYRARDAVQDSLR